MSTKKDCIGDDLQYRKSTLPRDTVSINYEDEALKLARERGHDDIVKLLLGRNNRSNKTTKND